MKRTTKVNKKPDLKEFLKDFTVAVNDGLHEDLDRSQDYLDKHELKDYINEDGHLVISEVEADEELTVEQVLHLGSHHAIVSFHKNWHKTMEEVAKKHGVDVDEVNAVKVELGELSELVDTLPPEVKKMVKGILDDILGGKKGKK